MENPDNQNKEVEHKKVRVRTGRVVALIAVIAIIALAFYFFKGYEPTGAAAAFVNGEKVSMRELDAQYELVPEMYRGFVTKISILEQLIIEKLLLQEAAKNGVVVSDSELNAQVDALKDSTYQSQEEFEQSLKEQGFSLDSFKDYYRKQLVISKLINETIADELQVSDSEALTYYQENLEQFLAEAPQIRARHILMETKEEAEDIIKKLDDGDDFAELAKEYSIGPTGPTGGELGFFRRGDVVKEFADVAFELERDEYTKEPVETQFGWHVIQRLRGSMSFDEAKEKIKSSLLEIKQQKAVEVYLAQLRNNADIEILFEDDGADQVDEGTAVTAASDDGDSCYGAFGLAKNTVIFYYLDSSKCPQCQSMLRIVDGLISEGYDFYYADIADRASLEVLETCFGGVVEGKAPLFICAGSGEARLGELKVSTLRDFAESCN